MRAGYVVAGKYELVCRLGAGGMGEVWRARHVLTEREFALKFLHPHVAANAEARARFLREAKASARIGHPNIVDILDAGEVADEETVYLAMELLEGASLDEALHAQPPLSTAQFLAAVVDVCRALAAAHGAGVVHRDVKPSNIFLHRDRQGRVTGKILDFGISKFVGGDDGVQTDSGVVLGSPRFMSPEQISRGKTADHRVDIWALGVMLFSALAGRWPHDGDSSAEIVVSIATSEPVSIDLAAPELHAELRAIIHACLERAPRRTISASDVADRLEALLAEAPDRPPLHPALPGPRKTTGLTAVPAAVTAVTADGPTRPRGAERTPSPSERPTAPHQRLSSLGVMPPSGPSDALGTPFAQSTDAATRRSRRKIAAAAGTFAFVAGLAATTAWMLARSSAGAGVPLEAAAAASAPAPAPPPSQPSPAPETAGSAVPSAVVADARSAGDPRPAASPARSAQTVAPTARPGPPKARDQLKDLQKLGSGL